MHPTRHPRPIRASTDSVHWALLMGGIVLATPGRAVAQPEPVDCAARSPAQVAEDLRGLVSLGRFEAVGPRVAALEAGLPCLDTFASAYDLLAVYQIGGAAAFYGNDLRAAEVWFSRAAVVNPTVDFDTANLGSAPVEAYAAARTKVAAAGLGAFEAVGPVVIDGSAVRTGSTLFVPIGPHLVQEVSDNTVKSEVFEVVLDTWYTVGTPDPARVAAQNALVERRRRTSWWTAGALGLLGGGLLTVAAVQEASLSEVQADSLDDPLARARRKQVSTQLSTLGAAVSISSGVAFALRGARADRTRSTP